MSFYRIVTSLLLASLFASFTNAEEKTNILMIAGARSHNYGAHEHYAGLKILEPFVSSEDVEVKVVKGWPQDDAIVEAADSIVIYCDGGRRHLAIPHLDRLEEKLQDGCGLVCLHYAIEGTKGEIGDRFVEMLGGHFEIHWSVNPHWIANFKTFPSHPITAGVKPFNIDDEWYFHLRFKDSPKVTPILAAVAPPETMSRPDGHHSGNPHARKSVEKGDTQTVAWIYDRPDGGRSFGFSGGHYHWNWASDEVRTIVARAIRWTAKAKPSLDNSDDQVTFDELLKNQDYEQPEKFDAEKTKQKFNVPELAGAK